jgi:hypothetical protein
LACILVTLSAGRGSRKMSNRSRADTTGCVASWVLQFAVAESHGKHNYFAEFAPCVEKSATDRSSAQVSAQWQARHTAGVGGHNEQRFLLATCGGPGARVYAAPTGEPAVQDLQLLVSYASSLPRADTDECFCCTWAFEEATSDVLLCLGYESGIIRVVHLSNDSLCHTLLGHSGAVHCLRSCPKRPSWLLSASKDESLRLWDLGTGNCFAIFCGLQGHRGEVLFCDWHRSGEKFVSCGMDGTVRVWNIDAKVLQSFEMQRRRACVAERAGEGARHSAALPKFPSSAPQKVTDPTPQKVLFRGIPGEVETPVAPPHPSKRHRRRRNAVGVAQAAPQTLDVPRNLACPSRENASPYETERTSSPATTPKKIPSPRRPSALRHFNRSPETSAAADLERIPYTTAPLVDGVTLDAPARGVPPPMTLGDDAVRQAAGSRTRRYVEFVQFPDQVFRFVHGNYVDCVAYVGDLILSKSVHSKIVLWAPGMDDRGLLPSSSEHRVLIEYRYRGGDLWYIRFAVDPMQTLLAVGSRMGTIYVFQVDDPGGKPIACLTHPQATAAVRHVAFSPDGKMILAVCDDSTVWRWDIESLTR